MPTMKTLNGAAEEGSWETRPGTSMLKAVLSTGAMVDGGRREVSSDTVEPRRAAFCVVTRMGILRMEAGCGKQRVLARV